MASPHRYGVDAVAFSTFSDSLSLSGSDYEEHNAPFPTLYATHTVSSDVIRRSPVTPSPLALADGYIPHTSSLSDLPEEPLTRDSSASMLTSHSRSFTKPRAYSDAETVVPQHLLLALGSPLRGRLAAGSASSPASPSLIPTSSSSPFSSSPSPIAPPSPYITADATDTLHNVLRVPVPPMTETPPVVTGRTAELTPEATSTIGKNNVVTATDFRSSGLALSTTTTTSANNCNAADTSSDLPRTPTISLSQSHPASTSSSLSSLSNSLSVSLSNSLSSSLSSAALPRGSLTAATAATAKGSANAPTQAQMHLRSHTLTSLASLAPADVPSHTHTQVRTSSVAASWPHDDSVESVDVNPDNNVDNLDKCVDGRDSAPTPALPRHPQALTGPRRKQHTHAHTPFSALAATSASPQSQSPILAASMPAVSLTTLSAISSGKSNVLANTTFSQIPGNTEFLHVIGNNDGFDITPTAVMYESKYSSMYGGSNKSTYDENSSQHVDNLSQQVHNNENLSSSITAFLPVKDPNYDPASMLVQPHLRNAFFPENPFFRNPTIRETPETARISVVEDAPEEDTVRDEALLHSESSLYDNDSLMSDNTLYNEGIASDKMHHSAQRGHDVAVYMMHSVRDDDAQRHSQYAAAHAQYSTSPPTDAVQRALDAVEREMVAEYGAAEEEALPSVVRMPSKGDRDRDDVIGAPFTDSEADADDEEDEDRAEWEVEKEYSLGSQQSGDFSESGNFQASFGQETPVSDSQSVRPTGIPRMQDNPRDNNIYRATLAQAFGNSARFEKTDLPRTIPESPDTSVVPSPQFNVLSEDTHSSENANTGFRRRLSGFLTASVNAVRRAKDSLLYPRSSTSSAPAQSPSDENTNGRSTGSPLSVATGQVELSPVSSPTDDAGSTLRPQHYTASSTAPIPRPRSLASANDAASPRGGRQPTYTTDEYDTASPSALSTDDPRNDMGRAGTGRNDIGVPVPPDALPERGAPMSESRLSRWRKETKLCQWKVLLVGGIVLVLAALLMAFVIELLLLTDINFDNISVSVDDLCQGGRFVYSVGVTMDNPSAFDVKVRGLSFDLQIGAKQQQYQVVKDGETTIVSGRSTNSQTGGNSEKVYNSYAELLALDPAAAANAVARDRYQQYLRNNRKGAVRTRNSGAEDLPDDPTTPVEDPVGDSGGDGVNIDSGNGSNTGAGAGAGITKNTQEAPLTMISFASSRITPFKIAGGVNHIEVLAQSLDVTSHEVLTTTLRNVATNHEVPDIWVHVKIPIEVDLGIFPFRMTITEKISIKKALSPAKTDPGTVGVPVTPAPVDDVFERLMRGFSMREIQGMLEDVLNTVNVEWERTYVPKHGSSGTPTEPTTPTDPEEPGAGGGDADTDTPPETVDPATRATGSARATGSDSGGSISTEDAGETEQASLYRAFFSAYMLAPPSNITLNLPAMRVEMQRTYPTQAAIAAVGSSLFALRGAAPDGTTSNLNALALDPTTIDNRHPYMSAADVAFWLHDNDYYSTETLLTVELGDMVIGNDYYLPTKSPVPQSPAVDFDLDELSPRGTSLLSSASAALRSNANEVTPAPHTLRRRYSSLPRPPTLSALDYRGISFDKTEFTMQDARTFAENNNIDDIYFLNPRDGMYYRRNNVAFSVWIPEASVSHLRELAQDFLSNKPISLRATGNDESSFLGMLESSKTINGWRDMAEDFAGKVIETLSENPEKKNSRKLTTAEFPKSGKTGKTFRNPEHIFAERAQSPFTSRGDHMFKVYQHARPPAASPAVRYTPLVAPESPQAPSSTTRSDRPLSTVSSSLRSVSASLRSVRTMQANLLSAFTNPFRGVLQMIDDFIDPAPVTATTNTNANTAAAASNSAAAASVAGASAGVNAAPAATASASGSVAPISAVNTRATAAPAVTATASPALATASTSVSASTSATAASAVAPAAASGSVAPVSIGTRAIVGVGSGTGIGNGAVVGGVVSPGTPTPTTTTATTPAPTNNANTPQLAPAAVQPIWLSQASDACYLQQILNSVAFETDVPKADDGKKLLVVNEVKLSQVDAPASMSASAAGAMMGGVAGGMGTGAAIGTGVVSTFPNTGATTTSGTGAGVGTVASIASGTSSAGIVSPTPSEVSAFATNTHARTLGSSRPSSSASPLRRSILSLTAALADDVTSLRAGAPADKTPAALRKLLTQARQVALGSQPRRAAVSSAANSGGVGSRGLVHTTLAASTSSSSASSAAHAPLAPSSLSILPHTYPSPITTLLRSLDTNLPSTPRPTLVAAAYNEFPPVSSQPHFSSLSYMVLNSMGVFEKIAAATNPTTPSPYFTASSSSSASSAPSSSTSPAFSVSAATTASTSGSVDPSMFTALYASFADPIVHFAFFLNVTINTPLMPRVDIPSQAFHVYSNDTLVGAVLVPKIQLSSHENTFADQFDIIWNDNLDTSFKLGMDLIAGDDEGFDIVALNADWAPSEVLADLVEVVVAKVAKEAGLLIEDALNGLQVNTIEEVPGFGKSLTVTFPLVMPLPVDMRMDIVDVRVGTPKAATPSAMLTSNTTTSGSGNTSVTPMAQQRVQHTMQANTHSPNTLTSSPASSAAQAEAAATIAALRALYSGDSDKARMLEVALMRGGYTNANPDAAANVNMGGSAAPAAVSITGVNAGAAGGEAMDVPEPVAVRLTPTSVALKRGYTPTSFTSSSAPSAAHTQRPMQFLPINTALNANTARPPTVGAPAPTTTNNVAPGFVPISGVGVSATGVSGSSGGSGSTLPVTTPISGTSTNANTHSNASTNVNSGSNVNVNSAGVATATAGATITAATTTTAAGSSLASFGNTLTGGLSSISNILNALEGRNSNNGVRVHKEGVKQTPSDRLVLSARYLPSVAMQEAVKTMSAAATRANATASSSVPTSSSSASAASSTSHLTSNGIGSTAGFDIIKILSSALTSTPPDPMVRIATLPFRVTDKPGNTVTLTISLEDEDNFVRFIQQSMFGDDTSVVTSVRLVGEHIGTLDTNGYIELGIAGHDYFADVLPADSIGIVATLEAINPLLSVCELSVAATAKLRTLPIVHARVLNTFFDLYIHDETGIPVLLPPAPEPVFVAKVTVLQDISRLRPLQPNGKSGGASSSSGRFTTQATQTAAATGASQGDNETTFTTMSAGMSMNPRRVRPLFFDAIMGELSSLFTSGFNSNKPVIGTVNEEAMSNILAANSASSANANANANASGSMASSMGPASPSLTSHSLTASATGPPLNDRTILREPHEEDVVASMRISSFNTCLRMVSALGQGKIVSDFRDVHTDMVLGGQLLPLRFNASRIVIQF